MWKWPMIAGVALFLSGCGEGDGGAEDPTGADGGGEAVEEAVEVPVKAVAPPVEEDWGPDECAAFGAYVAELSKDSYPRVEGTGTGSMFEKFVGSVEQPFYADSEIPLRRRAEMGNQMMESVVGLLNRYLAAHNAGISYREELLHLNAMMLPASRQMIGVLDESLGVIDREADDYETRKLGLEDGMSGLAMQLGSALALLKETEVFSDADRLIVAKVVAVEGAGLLGHLNAEARKEMDGMISGLVAAEKNEEIGELLGGLLGGLQER